MRRTFGTIRCRSEPWNCCCTVEPWTATQIPTYFVGGAPSGMSTIDEELNAMLQTDHHSSLAHSTLTSVITLTSSLSTGLGSEQTTDIYDFSSQYSSLHAAARAPRQLISSPAGGGGRGTHAAMRFLC